MRLVTDKSAAHTTAVSPQRQAVVLVFTMVIVVLLSLSGYYFSDLSVTEFKAANYQHRQLQAKAIADSGIHYALAILSDPTVLSDPTNTGNILNGAWPYHQPSLFKDVPVPADSDKGFSGRFTLLAPPDPGQIPGGQPTTNTFRYGVTDETGKMNLNAFLQIDPTGQMIFNIITNIGLNGNLDNVPGNLADIANSILDWMDPDETIRTNGGQGAESDSYSSLGYSCKDGPLDSLEELLLVNSQGQGVTPLFLFGNDRDRTGVGDGKTPVDQGWSRFFTVYSRELLVSPQGQTLVNLNGTNLQKLYQKLIANNLIDPELAAYIVFYRQNGPYTDPTTNSPGGPPQPAQKPPQEGNLSELVTMAQNLPTTTTATDSITTAITALTSTKINSIFELLNTKVKVAQPDPPNSSPNAKKVTVYKLYNCPLNDGNKAAAEQLMTTLFLNTTTYSSSSSSGSSLERPARININTAPPELVSALILSALQMNAQKKAGGTPSPTTAMQTELTNAPTNTTNILTTRPALDVSDSPDPVFQTPTWLYTRANVDAKTLTILDPYITTTSQVFRVQSEGELDISGPSARVEAVIDTNGGLPRIVYWRDLTELGKSSNVKVNK